MNTQAKPSRAKATRLTIAALSGLLAGGTLIGCNSSQGPVQKDSTPAAKSSNACSGADGCGAKDQPAGKTETKMEGTEKASCGAKDGCGAKDEAKKEGTEKAACGAKDGDKKKETTKAAVGSKTASQPTEAKASCGSKNGCGGKNGCG